MSYKGVKTLCERSDNWTIWSGKVKMRLHKIKYAWRHVNGDNKPDKVDQAEWDLAKYEALDIIMTHIGGSIEAETTGIRDPKELWETIKSMFKDRKGIEKCLALTKLMNTNMEGNIENYLKTFGQNRAKCIEIGWKLEDIFYAINIVNNLESKYDPLKQLLLAKGDDLKYKDAVEIIHAEAMTSKLEPTIDNGLKVVELRQRKCYKCGSTRHFIRDCPKWEKKKHQDKKSKPTSEKKNDDDDDAYIIDDNSSIDSDSSCYYDNCTAMEDNAYIMSSRTKQYRDNLILRGATSNKWVIDCAATKDMTFDGNKFKSITPVSGHYVRVGDGF